MEKATTLSCFFFEKKCLRIFTVVLQRINSKVMKNLFPNNVTVTNKHLIVLDISMKFDNLQSAISIVLL